MAIHPALAMSGIELINRWYHDPVTHAIMADCGNTRIGVWSENSLDRNHRGRGYTANRLNFSGDSGVLPVLSAGKTPQPLLEEAVVAAMSTMSGMNG